jgi:hypothetical protein
MPYERSSGYNGILAAGSFTCKTAAKFKLITFSVLGFAFFSISNRVELSWTELSWVEFATAGQPASSSWCRTALWGPWPDFKFSLVWCLLDSSCRAPSLTIGQVCILQCTSFTVQSRKGLIIIYYCLIWVSPAFISHWNRLAHLHPRALCSFWWHHMTHRVTVELF